VPASLPARHAPTMRRRPPPRGGRMPVTSAWWNAVAPQLVPDFTHAPAHPASLATPPPLHPLASSSRARMRSPPPLHRKRPRRRLPSRPPPLIASHCILP
jgi:hypothetical protein